MSNQSRKYACKNCNQPFEAIPPDDAHTYASLEPCSDGDSIPIIYDCDNCNNRTTIYWDKHNVGTDFLIYPIR